MNTIEYSIIYAMIRPEIQERVSVGIIFCEGGKIEVKYSTSKLDVVKNLVPETDYIYLRRSLISMATRNLLDSASMVDYLNRYSNNIMTVSKLTKIRMDSANISKDKLYRKYVYNSSK